MIDVGSDFSGIGAADQALIALKIDYKTVFACDMDKFARQSYIANYGEPEYYPENVYDREIPYKPLELYVSSPPCQSFSLAGKRKGESDKRGILFYNTHEFIIKNKPRYFIIENVKGLLSDQSGRTFQIWIDMLAGKSVNGNPVIFPREDSAPYHVYHKVLNAKDYGVPQNRERVFIIGIRDDSENHFKWPKKQHLNKRLKDILETDVDEKYYLSDVFLKAVQSHSERHQDKGNGFKFEPTKGNVIAKSITTKAGQRTTDNYIKVKSSTKLGYEIAKDGDSINLSQLSSETRRGRVGKGIAQTLDTACNQSVLIGAIRGHNPENPKSRVSGLPTEQMLEINENGTSNALTTVQKDNVVVYEQRNDEGMRFFKDNICGTIRTISDGGDKRVWNKTQQTIRRLTPRECLRLMSFPDSFKIVVSDSQAYKQAGNSIVKDVLARIIEKFNF